MIKQKPTSLADQVFSRLENDILSGVYKRGTILTELQLCQDLGVSRTPVREALHRLEQERVVESTGKGLRVLSITDSDVEAILEIRTAIERLAVENCARLITDDHIKQLKDMIDLQEFYVSKNNSEQLKQLDSEFHRTIYGICTSSIYYDTLAPLLERIQKVRKSALENPERAASSIGEHRTILDALIARDPIAAGEAMYVHTYNARKYALKKLEEIAK